MRIFDKKDVFAIVNTADAQKYINCEGYFCDSLYKDLKRWQKGILNEIVENATDYPFRKLNMQGGFSITFRLFLPAVKVKKTEKEKKWRAFRTFDELKENGLILGLNLAYRRKDNREQRNIGIITGFQLVDNKLTISIGPNTFSLNQLFNEYECYDALEWKPFGIEEAEETEECI